jgi:hypothetical protein
MGRSLKADGKVKSNRLKGKPSPKYGKIVEVFHADSRLHSEPQSWGQAMKSSQSEKWKSAADEELASLAKMKTWDVVDQPPNTKLIKSRWYSK